MGSPPGPRGSHSSLAERGCDWHKLGSPAALLPSHSHLLSLHMHPGCPSLRAVSSHLRWGVLDAWKG